MTAPLAPPPPRSLVLVLVGLVAVGLVIPLLRREDWVGRVAFLTVAAVALGIWGLLILGFARVALRWWRGDSESS